MYVLRVLCVCCVLCIWVGGCVWLGVHEKNVYIHTQFTLHGVCFLYFLPAFVL